MFSSSPNAVTYWFKKFDIPYRQPKYKFAKLDRAIRSLGFESIDTFFAQNWQTPFTKMQEQLQVNANTISMAYKEYRERKEQKIIEELNAEDMRE